jgi:hypothetical protein
MGQASLDFGEDGTEGLGPPIGIYSCVLCDSRYSMKVHLNQHYRATHRGRLPEYRGKKRQSILNRMMVNERVEKSLTWAYNLPSFTIQLIALLIFVLVYYNIQ